MRTQETPPREQKSLEQIITSIEDSLALVHAYCVQHTSSKPLEAAVIRNLLDLSGKAVLESVTKEEAMYEIRHIRSKIGQLKSHPDVSTDVQKLEALSGLILVLFDTEKVFALQSSEDRKLSRRDFLKAALAMTVSTLLGPGTVVLLNNSGRRDASTLEKSALPSDFDVQLNYIRDRYGLEIFTDISLLQKLVNVRRVEVLPDDQLYQAVLEIRKGLSVYPPDYFRNNGITGITAVKNIQAKGKETGGHTSAIENIVTVSLNAGGKEYFQVTIHHELFHRIDMFAISAPGKIVESIVSEQDWNSLFQVRANPMVGDEREEYFDYGQGEGVEDRAVYASALLVPAIHHRLLARIQAEPDLVKKAVYEEKIRKIKKKYFEWSGGKMNDQYWEDLLAGKVVEGYFS